MTTENLYFCMGKMQECRIK